MAPRTVLHLTDRLSRRGGADWHLNGVVDEQSHDHRVAMAVGRRDASGVATCPVHVVAGLDARTARPCDLNPLFESMEPDIIHVHNVVNPTALRWAAEHGAIMTVQDHRSFCPGRGKWLADGGVCQTAMSPDQCQRCFDDNHYFRDIVSLTQERLAAVTDMSAITVLSQYMREELILVGVAPERIHVIPPFVHQLPTPDSPEPNDPCVLFVGRLVEAKGVLDAMEAWEQAQTSVPLVFVGEGPLRERIEARGHLVTGWLSHDELAAWYTRAQALLLPSRWQEPFGIVGIEALTFGVPVVAYDSGGVREWHPGPGLVSNGDVSALATALDTHLGQTGTPHTFFTARDAHGALLHVYDTICASNESNACTA